MTFDPRTAPEIAAALGALHDESVCYWSEFADTGFFAQIGQAWSPATNVRHLTKSMRAVTKGLTMPRIMLRVMFGSANAPSRSYEVVRDTYRARLAKGASAGEFTPAPLGEIVDLSAERVRIMGYHAAAVDGLVRAIAKWKEPDLDRLNLPHPLLGPLTVREMLLFTLYHNRHHVDNVRRHLAQTAGVR